MDKFFNGYSNYLLYCKLFDFDENSCIIFLIYWFRLESDFIDWGVMFVDVLYGKVELLENCLDEIYCKMKSDFRDVCDLIKVLSRYFVELFLIISFLLFMGLKNNMYYFCYL